MQNHFKLNIDEDEVHLNFEDLKAVEAEDLMQKRMRVSDLDDEQFSFMLDKIYLEAVEKVLKEIQDEKAKH